MLYIVFLLSTSLFAKWLPTQPACSPSQPTHSPNRLAQPTGPVKGLIIGIRELVAVLPIRPGPCPELISHHSASLSRSTIRPIRHLIPTTSRIPNVIPSGIHTILRSLPTKLTSIEVVLIPAANIILPHPLAVEIDLCHPALPFHLRLPVRVRQGGLVAPIGILNPAFSISRVP
jgi:hypothetical protein